MDETEFRSEPWQHVALAFIIRFFYNFCVRRVNPVCVSPQCKHLEQDLIQEREQRASEVNTYTLPLSDHYGMNVPSS